MREAIIFGKIGPAFRTRQDTDGVVSVSVVNGSAYTMHYVTDDRFAYGVTTPREVRSSCLETLISCVAQDYAPYTDRARALLPYSEN